MILLKSVTFKIFFSYYHYPKPNINITMQHINGGNDVLMFLLYVDYIFLNSCNIQIRLTQNCTLNTSETCRKSGFQ